MSLSYFDGKTFSAKYTLNKYFTHRLGNNSILLTTEHGGWIVLNEEEYRLLRLANVWMDPDLFRNLEDKGIILTEKNFSKVVNCYRSRHNHLFNGTSLHIVIPTLRCNHFCIYCFAKSKPLDAIGYDMDEDTAKATVDFIFQSPSKDITIEISGGEPLANFPIVQYLIEYSKEKNKVAKKNLQYALVTNMTLMDNDILKYLMENQVGISTSLDGPKEVHNKNRKYLNSTNTYEDVVYWIDVIRKQHGYPKVGALPVVTKYSLPYAREIVDEYLSHGLKTLRLKYMTEVGHAQQLWRKIGYTPEEYLKLWEDTLDYILQLYKQGVAFNEGLTMLLLKKIIETENPGYTDLEMPCGAAISQLAYAQNGNIYTCDEARAFETFRIGNVRENTYSEVLTSKPVLDMVDLSSCCSLLCDECVWKPYCGICPVISYSVNKTVIPKLPQDFRCRIHSYLFDNLFKRLVFSKGDRDIMLKWVNTIRSY